MKRSKYVFLVFACVRFQVVFAQWQQLPDLAPLGQYRAFPVANGKLFAGIDHIPNPPSSSTPPFTEFGRSNDDLNSFTNDLYLSLTFAPASVSAGASANDSTVCFRYGPRVIFTFDGFSTAKDVSIILNASGASLARGASCITSKFIYCTQSAYHYSPPPAYFDTLVLVRENPAAIKVITKIPRYIDPNKKMRFVNDSTGFLLVNGMNNQAKSCLIKTVNFGQTWSEVMVDSINQISDFSFPSASAGYVTKTDGSVHKTINGGASWNQVSTFSVSLNCIQFASDTLGYLGANSGLLWKTSNGGNTWQSEISNTTNNITELYTFGTVAYFVVNTGRVFKNQPGVAAIKNISENNYPLNVFPNPAYDELTIDLGFLKNDLTKIRITNILDETVFQKQVEELNHSPVQRISVKDLSSGTYFVVCETKTGIARKKISVIK